MSDINPEQPEPMAEQPETMAEAAREYRRTLVEHYRHTDRGRALSGQRPNEARLPTALRELVQRIRREQPQRRFELLKYRHTVGDEVVTEYDDGAPMPPEEQLMMASVTTSVVLADEIRVEVHLLIGAWQPVGR